VRVCAVSQCQSLGRASALLTVCGIGVLLAEVPADGLVVPRGHLERLEREPAPERGSHVAVALRPRLHKISVIRGIGEHRDALMVFGRGAQQCDAADVDLLDGVCEGASWSRDGRRERIQVADDDGDGRDGLRCEVLLIGGDVACEDACARVVSKGWNRGLDRALTTMHNGMEGLYTAAKHLRCFGDIGNISLDLVQKPLSYRGQSIVDVLYGQSSIPDLLRCTSRAE